MDGEKIEGEEKSEVEVSQPEIKEEKKAEIKKETPKERPERQKFNGSIWYDKHYKKLLLVAILIFVASVVSIGIFYAQNGDIMHKDVTLTGGTAITVYTDQVNIDEISTFLKGKLGPDVSIRRLEDITTRKTTAFVVETTADSNALETALEEYLKYSLDGSNSSTEISGSTLAKTFYKQLLIAMIIAFIFMALVVFIIFKTFIPSVAVVFCAATDVIGALALANMFGFRVSTAGIAALIMLIGYSVDTDTMLTTKVIKRKGEGTLNSRIHSAFKTGIIMTLTSLVAVLAGYFIAQSSVLKEIFFILSCGLFMDLIMTWVGNAAILKWWCEKKKIN
jgi:preprotein translocase subunit SecF